MSHIIYKKVFIMVLFFLIAGSFLTVGLVYAKPFSFNQYSFFSSTGWKGVATSDDASLIYAINSDSPSIDNGIFCSYDGGITFNSVMGSQGPEEGWVDIAVSSSGGYGIAAPAGTSFLYALSGSTGCIGWTQVWGPANFKAVGMTRNGDHMFAAVYGAYILDSTNYGINFNPLVNVPTEGGFSWQDMAVGGTGSAFSSCKLLLNDLVGLYFSSDCGVSWTTLTSPVSVSNINKLAVSGDGNTLVVVGYYTGVSVSTDGGATWSTVGPYDRVFDAVTTSYDGNVIAASAGGVLFISTDHGETFVQDDSTSFGTLTNGLALTYYGNKLFVSSSDSYLNYATDNEPPALVSFDSDTPDGYYNAGDEINLKFIFSEEVDVSDGALLTATFGGISSSCVVSDPVSQSRILSCTFIVEEGDTSSDLAVSSVTFNSGFIADYSSNQLVDSTYSGDNVNVSHNIVIDTTTPASPGTPNLADLSDLGSSSTDDITSDSTPTFTSTCENSATVTLYDTSTQIGTGTCSSGSVSITSSVLTGGSHSIRAKQTDLAGNISNYSSSILVTIDTTAPTISEVTPITTPGTDTTPSYTFTTDEEGSISYGGSCSSVTTSASSGSNTIVFDELAIGTYTDCTLTITDTAGNTSSTLTVTSFTITGGGNGSGGGFSTTQVISGNGNITTISGGALFVVPIFNFSSSTAITTQASASTSVTAPVLIPEISSGIPTNIPSTAKTGINLFVNKQVFVTLNGTVITFNKNLGTRSPQNTDIKKLQVFLNSVGFPVAAKGFGSIGNETNKFGPATKQALLEFQKAVGIKGANGNFGPATRTFVNKLLQSTLGKK